jgi:hypothetical protein
MPTPADPPLVHISVLYLVIGYEDDVGSQPAGTGLAC